MEQRLNKDQLGTLSLTALSPISSNAAYKTCRFLPLSGNHTVFESFKQEKPSTPASKVQTVYIPSLGKFLCPLFLQGVLQEEILKCDGKGNRFFNFVPIFWVLLLLRYFSQTEVWHICLTQGHSLAPCSTPANNTCFLKSTKQLKTLKNCNTVCCLVDLPEYEKFRFRPRALGIKRF